MNATATPIVDASERVHLARAIAMATRARGTTAPNPTVGCVLLLDGEVVGQGVTRPVGGAHAEVVALGEAGARARGATALVTLEPCDHHGRTPPCTDALIAAGVRRVVVAHPDPNPTASGGGSTLAAAGIDVVAAPAPFRDWVAGELEGFLTHVRRGRPHVTLKVAQTLDGAMTAPEAGQRWITGRAARRAVHRWRAGVDAVLVGGGTVVADDPRLDVRDVPLGPRPQPRPVVLDGRLRVPPTAQVVARGALIVTRQDADPVVAERLRSAGAQVVSVPASDDRLDLVAALAAVAASGASSVLAEPGPTLGAALLDAGLVDRLVRHVGLEVGSGRPRPTFEQDATGWRTTRVGGAGRDLIWERVPSTSIQEQR